MIWRTDGLKRNTWDAKRQAGKKNYWTRPTQSFRLNICLQVSSLRYVPTLAQVIPSQGLDMQVTAVIGQFHESKATLFNAFHVIVLNNEHHQHPLLHRE